LNLNLHHQNRTLLLLRKKKLSRHEKTIYFITYLSFSAFSQAYMPKYAEKWKQINDLRSKFGKSYVADKKYWHVIVLFIYLLIFFKVIK